MIIFRSDGVQHQVLPSLRRSRIAITIWMYGNMKQKSNNKIQQQNAFSATAVASTASTAVVGHKIDKSVTGLSHSIPRTCDVTSPEKTDVEAKSNDRDESNSTIPQPPPLQVPGNNAIDDQNLSTIFVSIASYRDSETVPRELVLHQRGPRGR